jgi:SET domain-containing protein
MIPIELPESDYLYTDVSQIEHAGSGLYTAIKIFKGEIIALFKGTVLNEKQIEKRIALKQDQYFMNLPNGSILDAGKTKGFAKYANDAQAFENGKFRNNAIISIDDEENICLIAKRNIKEGEEIFCSYGKRYWKKHGK